MAGDAGADTRAGSGPEPDVVPPFGAAESRRLLDAVLAHPELDDVPVGAISVALADIRATLAAVYGTILPALHEALAAPAPEAAPAAPAAPAADAERARTLLEDLRYAFRRVDLHLHRVGWQHEAATHPPSLIDLRAVCGSESPQ